LLLLAAAARVFLNRYQMLFSRHGFLTGVDWVDEHVRLPLTWALIGCLVAGGAGRQPPAWLGDVLASRRRERAAPTFAADGLYFLGPYYDARHGLPLASTPVPWGA